MHMKYLAFAARKKPMTTFKKKEGLRARAEKWGYGWR
jgi:hypothetical protein